MATTRKKATQQNPITARELKAMIDGIELISGDNWAPDKQQWKNIRIQIARLRDEEVVSTEVYLENYEDDEVEIHHPPQHRELVIPSSSMQPDHQQPVQQFVPTRPTTPLAPAAPKLQIAADGSIKTPNIDSSEGYQSGFE